MKLNTLRHYLNRALHLSKLPLIKHILSANCTIFTSLKDSLQSFYDSIPVLDGEDDDEDNALSDFTSTVITSANELLEYLQHNRIDVIDMTLHEHVQHEDDKPSTLIATPLTIESLIPSNKTIGLVHKMLSLLRSSALSQLSQLNFKTLQPIILCM